MDSAMPSQEPAADDKDDDADLPSEETDGVPYIPSSRNHGGVKDDSEVSVQGGSWGDRVIIVVQPVLSGCRRSGHLSGPSAAQCSLGVITPFHKNKQHPEGLAGDRGRGPHR
ncbi:protein kinase C zeta [Phyllostomus discolor]|uniref:Protein kinase C zeta n=1 Tax=Phyllostomus discolor TaxID=89673 RepID=A0A834AH17_9CHIR|nr:protein kinase C zeta [Phyllostomus discolor]